MVKAFVLGRHVTHSWAHTNTIHFQGDKQTPTVVLKSTFIVAMANDSILKVSTAKP